MVVTVPADKPNGRPPGASAKGARPRTYCLSRSILELTRCRSEESKSESVKTDSNILRCVEICLGATFA